jgi:hypothetical protein
MNLKNLCVFIMLGALGCRGGGRGIDDITSGGAGGAGGEGGAGGADDAGPDADTTLTCETPQARFPTCPRPAEGEFPIEIEGWQTETSAMRDIEGNAYVYETTDTYGLPDGAQALIGRLSRGGALAAAGLPGEVVRLFTWSATGDWFDLGTAESDERGYYRFDLGSAFGTGEHIAYATFPGDGTCGPHGVFLWPRGTQVILTDIDGTLTLSDAELTRQIGDPSYVPRENTSSPELVRAWYEKGYKVIYLSARPHTLRLPTRAWLELKDLPYGPLITANSLVFGESARVYKRAAIQQLVNEFGWEIVAAYGNAGSDIQAYEDAGHPKDTTFIIGEEAGRSGTVAIPDNDYTQHIQTYVNPHPDARQPAGLVQQPFCR